VFSVFKDIKLLSSFLSDADAMVLLSKQFHQLRVGKQGVFGFKDIKKR